MNHYSVLDGIINNIEQLSTEEFKELLEIVKEEKQERIRKLVHSIAMRSIEDPSYRNNVDVIAYRELTE